MKKHNLHLSEIKYADVLQVSGYGRHPSKEELMELFPFFD